MIAPVTLPSGRTVLDTGKRNGKMPLYIGILGKPLPPRDPGLHAELMQRVMTAPLPREWHEHPVKFQVSRPWWRRLWELVR